MSEIAMDALLDLLPKKELLFAVIEVFLPMLVALLLFLKGQKDSVVADLNDARKHMASGFDLLEDAIALTLEGLGADSPDGRILNDEEKAESLEVAMKALKSFHEVKDSLISAIPFRD
jgi:hypothetical protein